MTGNKRYLALDVLRGITIAGMILVNTPGSWSYVYSPLRHASWHGCTPTDLVFPFFLFVMGVSMFFSFSKNAYELNKHVFLKIGKRALIIFVLGLFLRTFPQWQADFSNVRLLGVLQRIAIVYFIASLIVLSFRIRVIQIISLALLITYWLILYVFGGDAPYSLEQNVVGFIDLLILGEKHMYLGFGIPFEPEGLMSSIGALVSVLIGYVIGYVIVKTKRKKLPFKLLLIGTSLAIVGWVWGLILPLNKALWTSSYVMYTGGLAVVCLSILIFLIDIKGYKTWAKFFSVFGVNPLFIFFISAIWVRVLSKLISFTNEDGIKINGYNALYEYIMAPLFGSYNGSLVFALLHVFIFWFIAWLMYQRKIFIKV
ncbi:acyltransferase family protein [Carboxylicivirga sp. N1Y90]|uniref:acyltransferase family protein n=1 Tax=Carboxylicivirga fragile TaxID=3417571 RepID=UPI003D33659C|nr:DUF5009 domain-containing protein [Marinilabiliaceae bacterium N1Y90]